VSRSGEAPGGAVAQEVTQAFQRAGLRSQQRGGAPATPTPPYVPPGEYQVLLKAGDHTRAQKLQVIQP